MFALTKLIGREFAKSFFGPFFIFVFPLLLLSIIGSINKMPINSLLPGLIASGFVSITANGMAFTMVEYKSSVIIKRIAVTPVKKSDFVAAILLFYTVVLAVSALWLIAWSFIFFGRGDAGIPAAEAQARMAAYYASFEPGGAAYDLNQIHYFFYKAVNWGAFIVYVFICMLFAISLGLIIVTISGKSVNRVNLYATILIPAGFLTGGFMPLNLIDRSDVLFWISHFLPMRYSSNLLVNSFVGDLGAKNSAGDVVYNIVKTTFGGHYISNAWQEWYVNVPIVGGSTFVFAGLTARYYRWE